MNNQIEVNQGACGIYAYLFYRIRKYTDFNLKIIFLYNPITKKNNYFTIEKITEYNQCIDILNGKGGQMYAPDHVVLCDGKEFFDFFGTHDITKYKRAIEVPFWLLKKALNEGYWGESFKEMCDFIQIYKF